MVVHDVSVEDFLDIDDVFSAEVIRVTKPDQLPSALAQKNKLVVIENNEMARRFLRLQRWQEARKWIFSAIVVAVFYYAISRDYKIEVSWHRDWKVNTLDGKVI